MKKATTYREQLSICCTLLYCLNLVQKTVAIIKTLIVADNLISGMH